MLDFNNREFDPEKISEMEKINFKINQLCNKIEGGLTMRQAKIIDIKFNLNMKKIEKNTASRVANKIYKKFRELNEAGKYKEVETGINFIEKVIS